MKSTILIIVITTIGLLTISIILILAIHQASENEVVGRFRAGQTMTAHQLSREMEDYLRARSQGLQVLSTFASLQHRDSEKMAADIQQYFKYVKKDYVKAISVYDEKGTIIHSTTKDAIGRNYANCDFFQWATLKENKGKQFVSSLIQVSENQIEPPPYSHFVIVTPVYQEARDPRYPKPTHKFVGVLTVTIDLEEVVAAFLPVLTTNLTKDQVWIMDTSGTILFQSEHPEMVLRSIHRRDETCMKCHISVDYVEKVLAEKQGTVEYTLREQPTKVAAFTTLRFENVTWILVVNVPLDEVSGFFQRQLARTLLLIGVIAVALVSSSTLIYRSNRLKIRAQEEAKRWREKRELEEKIRQSEEQYRQLVEISPDAVAVHCEGKIVFVNSAGVRALGATSSAELIGKSALEIVHPDDREMVKRRIAAVLAEGKPAPLNEERFLRLDGSLIDVEVAAVATTFQDKPAVQVVVRDITERKRMERELQESERILRLISENTTDVIFAYDMQRLLIYVNPAVQELTGYTVAELREKNFINWLHPEAKARMMAVWEDVFTGKSSSGEEFRIVTKDGQIKWCLSSWGPLYDESGRQIGVQGRERDITERKLAEESLRESEARYKSLYHMIRLMCDNVPDLIWAKDLEKEFIFANKAICNRLLNAKDSEEPIGKTDMYFAERERSSHQDQPDWHDFGKICTDSDSIVISSRHADRFDEFGNARGQFLYLDVFKAPFWDENGEMIGTVGCGRDVTGEKQLEEEHKLAEEALKVSEERQRLILQSLPAAIYVTPVDPEVDATWISGNVLELTGYSASEFVAEAHFWRRRLHPDDHHRVLKAFGRAAISGKLEIEYRWQIKDGQYKWFLDRCTKHQVDNRQEYFGVLIDITELKRAEEALKENEQRFRSLTEFAITGVYLIQEGVFGYVNPVLATIFGYDVDEIVNKLGPLDLAAPEDRDVITENIRKRVEGVIPQIRYSFKGLRKDGQRIDIEVHGARIDYHGKPAIIGTLLDITERKRAEEALRESEFWTTESQRVGRIGSYVLDLKTGYWTSSDVLDEIFGIDKNFDRSIEGWGRIVHPEQRQEVIEYFEKDVIAHAAPFDKDYRIVRPSDGQERWVAEQGELVCDEKGNLLKMFGTIQDITERKKAEEKLRKSEARFRGYFDLPLLGTAITSPEKGWIEVNSRICSILGYTRDELARMTWADMTYPDDLSADVEQFDRLLSGEIEQYTLEKRFIRKDGGVIWTSIGVGCVRESDGNVDHIVAYMEDISARKRAEEALRSSEEKYRALIGHMNDGLLVVDNNDAIQFVNEKLCKMVGYTQEELIGNIGYRMLLPEESWNLLQEKNRRRIREISEQYELNVKKKSGERFWASVSASPVYGSKGEVIGSMAVISDISVRKLAEEASRQAAEEIGKAHEQLVQLNKHLTEVKEEERALISREIHDELGQSLTALKIDLNWAREHIGKNPVVKQRLNGMLDIVNSTVKNVQRIASELRPGILDDLGLASAIEWYCEEFEKRSGIRSQNDLEDIQTQDPHKNIALFRILQEALTNVARHAHAKHVTITLSRIENDIMLQLLDDGVGISPDKIDSKHSLGLIGMRERAKQFGGSFEILSERKKGTTVRISLPIHS